MWTAKDAWQSATLSDEGAAEPYWKRTTPSEVEQKLLNPEFLSMGMPITT